MNVNYLFGIIIFVYIFLAIALNIIGVYSLFILSFILIFFYNFKNAEKYNISDKHWRLFALFGTVSTGITLLINGLNIFKDSNDTDNSNMHDFNKLGLQATRDIENMFMKYKKELGYLFNNIYGSIGKDKLNDYTSTRDLDLEYLAALKIFKQIEAVFLVGINVYGIQKISHPDFQGLTSSMYTMFSCELMKNYWVQLKPLFQDEIATIFDSFMIYGRISN